MDFWKVHKDIIENCPPFRPILSASNTPNYKYVDSFCTNIPLEEGIDICANTLFENTEKVEVFFKKQLNEFLSLTTKESYVNFNGKLYKQFDGHAMGPPLDPKLANAFLVYFKKSWFQNCAFGFKLHYYRRYVDDIIVLFTSPEHLEAFQNFLNGRHAKCHYNWKWKAKQDVLSWCTDYSWR